MKRERHWLRKIIKVSLTFFSALLFILLSLFFVLKSSRVQTYFTQRISAYLSQEYQTVIKTGRVNISLFDGLVLEDLYVEDQQKDTLLSAGSVGVFPKGFPGSGSNLNFRSISLHEVHLNVYQLPDSTLNIQFIVDAFMPEEESDSADFRLRCGQLSVEQSRLTFKELSPDTVHGINYGDLNVTDFNFDLQDFELFNDDLDFESAAVSFKEQSGFVLNKLFLEQTALKSDTITTESLQIHTPGSFIELRNFLMDYSSPESFSDFADAVSFEGTFSDSTHVLASDLNNFLPVSLAGFDDLALSGSISGQLNRLKIRNFKLRLGNILRMQMHSQINKGLNPDSAAFDIEIQDFRVYPELLGQIRIEGTDSAIIDIPTELSAFRQIDFQGAAAGNTHEYRTIGSIDSPGGKIDFRFSGGSDSLRSHFLTGQVSTQNIALGKILDNSAIGEFSAKQSIDFALNRDETIALEAAGMIDSIDYNNYRYRAVSTYADVNESDIDSFSVSVKDPNIDLAIEGSAELRHQLPLFNFSAEVNHLDLNALNLYTDQKPARLSFLIEGNFSGDTPDSFTGQIALKKPLNIALDTIEARLDNFVLSSEVAAYEHGDEIKRYRLYSDVLDAEMMLKGSTTKVLGAVRQTLTAYMPALFSEFRDNSDYSSVRAELDLKIKDSEFVFRFIDPDMALAENTTVLSNYDARNNFMDIKMESPGFQTGEFFIKNFYFEGETKEDYISMILGSSENSIGLQTGIKNLELKSHLFSDTADINLLWNNHSDTLNTKADIKAKIAFEDITNDSTLSVRAALQKSMIVIDGQNWEMMPANIRSDSSHIQIQGIEFRGNNEKIALNGDISKDPDSELNLHFFDFELKNLQNIMPEDFEINGRMNGSFRLKNLYSDFIVLTNDTIDNLRLNNISLGDMFLKSNWDNSLSGLKFSFYNKFGDPDLGQKVQVTDSVYGTYWPETDSVSLAGNFEGFNLRTFSPLYKDYINFMRGSQLTGDFKAGGYLKDIQLSGSLALKITGLAVNYLETAYSVNESLNLSFNNELIRIDTTKLYSPGGGEAFLFGDVEHNSFKNFNLDIALQTNKFQFLNTPPADTSYFYGTAFGSGLILVSGSQDDLLLDIDITTDKNTAFFIPLTSSESPEEEQSFMDFKEEEKKEEDGDIFAEESDDTQDDSGGDMTINMNLAVTPGAEIQLIMDEQTGDIIKALGSGDLKIVLNPSGDFQMFGDYTIEKGDYLFTLQNFFSKHFTIKKGGTIHWTGNPEDADIDLTALYSLPKVGVYSLLLDPNMQGAKTPVNCVIDMKGDLNTPNIKFDIELLNDEYRIAQHFKALEQDEINEQFLSLLLIGSFQPLPGLSQEAATGSPVKIGELVSNQLNRRLSDLTKDVDVGVNYQTGSDITTDELALELSTRLWNDRITIGGNLGVGGGLRDAEGGNTQTDNIIGEVEVNVKLNPKGTVQLKAYNKANDDYTYDKGQYTQGVGFFWRREFDKFLFLKAKNANDASKNNSKNDSLPDNNNNSAIKPEDNNE